MCLKSTHKMQEEENKWQKIALIGIMQNFQKPAVSFGEDEEKYKISYFCIDNQKYKWYCYSIERQQVFLKKLVGGNDMKKILATVLVALMILSMVACSDKPDTGEGDAWVGGYACHSANDFFDAIEIGLEEAAAANNGTILRADSELSTAGELAIIENFISQSVDVIFLTPDDPSGSIEGVKLANDAGIPVVVISSELAEGDYEVLCTIKSDDYTAASGAAEYAMQKIDGEGNVLILNGMQTSDVIDRINGYKDTIAKYPNVKVANEVMVTENSVAACTTAIENMLQACPDAKAILCFNGFGIPAGYAAMENLGIDTNSISVVDVDGLQAEADLLASGDMAMSCAYGQNTPEFGRRAVAEYLKSLEEGDSYQKGELFELETIVVTPDNAADYDIYKNLHK